MTAPLVHCRKCGAPYEPSREDLLRGPRFYFRCPSCRPGTDRPQKAITSCRECGRPLRGTNRDICLSCLGVVIL